MPSNMSSVSNDIHFTMFKGELSNQVINNIAIKSVIDENTGCFLYIGEEKYPRVYYKFRLELLSRIVCHLKHGLDFEDKEHWALHKTICPNTNCWNSEHLYVGNRSQNTMDSVVLRSHNSNSKKYITHCPKGHEYTPENTKIQKGTNKRSCRECDKNRKRMFGELGTRRMGDGKHYSSRKE